MIVEHVKWHPKKRTVKKIRDPPGALVEHDVGCNEGGEALDELGTALSHVPRGLDAHQLEVRRGVGNVPAGPEALFERGDLLQDLVRVVRQSGPAVIGTLLLRIWCWCCVVTKNPKTQNKKRDI